MGNKIKSQKSFSDIQYKQIFVFGILAVVGFAVYSNALSAGFHFDDISHIVKNYSIRHAGNPAMIWESFRARFICGYSFAINYYFSGLNAYSYHLVNIIIHIINAFLVFILSKTILSSPSVESRPENQKKIVIGFLAALIFLVHPLQTEAVTYISQRFSVLATFFYLSAVICYLKARIGSNTVFYILSIFATGLAMLTKEFSFTIPITLILCEIYFINKGGIREKSVRLVPFLLSLTIIPLVILFSNNNAATIKLNEQLLTSKIIWHYLFTEINVMRTYLRLLFLPINQNLDYDYPIAYHFFEIPTILSFLLLCALFALGLYLFKKRRVVSFCIMWFFVTISVEFAACALINTDLIFEHFLYLPMVGFALLISVLLVSCFKNTKWLIIISSSLIVILSGMAYLRNAVWENRQTLWQDVIKKSPNKARPYNNLAIYYDEVKEHEKAIGLYKKAIELDPESSAHFINLGSSYGQTGAFDKALQYTLQGIQLKDDLNYLTKAYVNLGYIYEKTGALDKSIHNYQIAIEQDPYNAEVYVNLSAVFLKQGNYKKAIEYALKGISYDPHIAQAYNNLGMSYGQEGKTDKAIKYFNRGIEEDPNNSSIYINLGRAFIKKNELKRAINVFTRCLNIDPNEAQAHFLLGFSYLKTKQVERAVQKVNDLKKMNELKMADSLDMIIKERNLFDF